MPKLAKSTSAALGVVWAALAGDMTMVVSPETVAPAPSSDAWTRDVEIKIVDSNGKVHEWLSADFTTKLSIADTSVAGTASIASTTLKIREGKAIVTVSGDAQSWLNTETDTLTVANLTIMGYTVTGDTSVETFTT
jgi:anti-sigma factor RsiW